ncbi:MAG: von Willebrand factor type A domain-containing protein [Gemmatimonadota bacterium]|jgi:Ca-activated chloride channel family protein
MFANRIAVLLVLLGLGWPGESVEIWPTGTLRINPERAVILTGKVTDRDSGNPIQGVQVSVENTGHGALTDSSGTYTLNLPDLWIGNQVTVVMHHVGYETAKKRVRLSAGSNTLDVRLAPSETALDNLVVTVAREAAELAGRVLAPAAMYSVSDAALQGLPGRFNPNFHTESYAHIQENVFLAAAANPLSTFSIDVDRASYANVRRFIHDGVRPPIDAVRIEELINYFPYSDAAPTGNVPLAIYTEVATAPWQPLHRLVRIGLKGRSIDMGEAPHSNLVFLLDVSGSMNSPDKLPLLKTAFSMLVNQLRPEDRVAIVVYAGAAGLVLPSTPGSEKETILEAIQSLEAGGSTAGGAGIKLAFKVAAENHIEGGNNRVILATDGDFNVGVSSDSEMIRLIEDKRSQGTFLTVLGFGTGNLKDSKMEQIADHGNGNFSYIDSALEAKKVLVNEMGGTLLTIAKDVKLQVEFNPNRVAAYRLIGYENRLLAAEDFDDDTKDAGELGAGHSVTALYEVIPAGVESPVEIRGLDPLRYQTPGNESNATDSDELLFVKLRYKEPDQDTSRLLDLPVLDHTGEASDDFRFASAVAAWGMLLRDSEYCTGFGLQDVAELAGSALGPDEDGYRSEFVRLVETARTLELLAMEPGQSH